MSRALGTQTILSLPAPITRNSLRVHRSRDSQVRRPVAGQRQHAHAHVCLALPGGLSPSLRPRPPPPGRRWEAGWAQRHQPERQPRGQGQPRAPAPPGAGHSRPSPHPAPARVAPRPAEAARARRPGRRYLIDGQLHGVAEGLQQGGAGGAGGGHGPASALRPPAPATRRLLVRSVPSYAEDGDAAARPPLGRPRSEQPRGEG